MKEILYRNSLIFLMAGSLLWCTSSTSGPERASLNATQGSEGDLASGSRTILGVEVGMSNLKEVQERLGSSPVRSSGDAGTAENSICYVTDGQNPAVVVFASNAEMGGPPENVVTDIRVLARQLYPSNSRCRKLNLAANKIGTKTGLKLGLDKRNVETILGFPSNPNSSEWHYTWKIERPLPTSDRNYRTWLTRKEECFGGKDPFFTTMSTMVVQFDGETVVSVSLSRIDSIC